jgi:hypothetical protein
VAQDVLFLQEDSQDFQSGGDRDVELEQCVVSC